MSFVEISPWDYATVSYYGGPHDNVSLGWVIAELEYIVNNADYSSYWGLYCAQNAVWCLTNPENHSPGNGGAELLAAARAYAASGSDLYAGTAGVLMTTNGAYYSMTQPIVLLVSSPKGSIELTKTALSTEVEY